MRGGQPPSSKLWVPVTVTVAWRKLGEPAHIHHRVLRLQHLLESLMSAIHWLALTSLSNRVAQNPGGDWRNSAPRGVQREALRTARTNR
jgi:hypothetical protein